MSFNPTMVRLLLVKQEFSLQQIPEFQSHNGAIAAFAVYDHNWNQISGFNPTMVRLLPNGKPMTCWQRRLFQSHNGAIAASPTKPCLRRLSSFNPTMVRLLRENFAPIGFWVAGFNPTMVRLLLMGLILRNLGGLSFQSHNGAIAAIDKSQKDIIIPSFNPTMVRLLHAKSK